jgi:PhzF family phenazine biosynthesis protein
MKIPIYQVDAFTSRLFAGNPAAVCPLEAWLEDATMQAIAAENNLSETAFFVPCGDRFHLRWFTPAVEVDLCGHATLATAFVIFSHLSPERDAVAFDTQSGELVVRRDGDRLAMDFPARPPQPVRPHERLVDALGTQPDEVLASRDYLVVYHDQDQVRTLQPDMELVAGLDRFAVIVTAPSRDCDFVSRFFAPAQGVAEDPVTGSAHCTLVPYWSKRLRKSRLHARQLSARGGELFCEDLGERVQIAGHVVLYLKGEISVPRSGPVL